AAPNMGRETIKSLVFIMAMLNIRLGYWLPNPKYVGVMGRARRQVTRVGPIYLIREMMGNLDEDSWNINLSDGGHIENLGVYELLRRECRLIIAADAERDKDLEFGGLAAVIRMAQIDMGITIEMDGLEEIRSGRQHYALGTIRYKDGKIGKLIYLKSSLVETDRLYEHVNAYVAHYKAKNSEFPHESTGDQFFDEEQFECYRALGYEVTKSVFG
ncbi:MAG: cell division protein, partial [Alphaproteobacteria bacterium]|nr:cell division protein [Alphaproteobacteria bacterium]